MTKTHASKKMKYEKNTGEWERREEKSGEKEKGKDKRRSEAKRRKEK